MTASMAIKIAAAPTHPLNRHNSRTSLSRRLSAIIANRFSKTSCRPLSGNTQIASHRPPFDWTISCRRLARQPHPASTQGRGRKPSADTTPSGESGQQSCTNRPVRSGDGPMVIRHRPGGGQLYVDPIHLPEIGPAGGAVLPDDVTSAVAVEVAGAGDVKGGTGDRAGGGRFYVDAVHLPQIRGAGGSVLQDDVAFAIAVQVAGTEHMNGGIGHRAG